MKLEALYNAVIVKPVEAEETSYGGIIVPDLGNEKNKLGKVVAVGKGVIDFKVGDRVASNGQHAEFVSVPQNLVAHIPENISDEEAAFTVIGSIGYKEFVW